MWGLVAILSPVEGTGVSRSSDLKMQRVNSIQRQSRLAIRLLGAPTRHLTEDGYLHKVCEGTVWFEGNPEVSVAF
jgi:hypothetical protein